MLGPQHNQTQIKEKEQKRKQMPTLAVRRNKAGPQPLRPPKVSHRTPGIPNRRVPSNTFMKGCDDDAAAARSGPRVSPGTRKGGGEEVPDALQEGMATPTGVTASVPDGADRGFAHPQKTTTPDGPKRSTQSTANQHAPPRKRHQLCHLTVDIGARPRGTSKRTVVTGVVASQPRGRELPPPPW